MAKKQTKVEQAPVDAAPQQEQQQPNLNLQDLILVAQIIQVSSQRGAFKADELANVGALYNKLIAFLQSTGALTPAPANTEENQNA